jgi:hypothetical protein
MSFNSVAYLAHEERLLEPDHRIITGNHKRYHEIKRELVVTLPGPVWISEQEDNERQDEYLKKHNV